MSGVGTLASHGHYEVFRFVPEDDEHLPFLRVLWHVRGVDFLLLIPDDYIGFT
jgi:hypothetical protein